MTGSRLYQYVAAGVAIAEVSGFCALALWALDQYAFGFSALRLVLAFLVCGVVSAAIGAVAGAAGYVICKPRVIR